MAGNKVRSARLRRLTCLTLLAGALACGCGGPRWYIDAGFGERLAADKKKPLLIYFKAWDSTAHRNMKMKVLDSGVVGKELTDTVNVEVEWSWSGPMKDKYRITRPQVCVFCAPDGREVGRMTVDPVPDAAAFAKWVRETKSLAKGEAPKPKEVSSAALFSPGASDREPTPGAVTIQLRRSPAE